MGKTDRILKAVADDGFRYSLRLASLAFLGLCFYLIASKNDGSFVALLAACVCLFGTRLAEIVGFKLSLTGLETNLQNVIHDAEVTLEQFNDFATSWGKVALEQLLSEGRYGGISRSTKTIIRNDIFGALDALKVPPADMEAIKAIEYRYNHFDYVNYVFKAVTLPQTREWNTALTGFNAAHVGVGNEANPDQLETLLASHNLVTPEVTARLADYRHYELTRAHRRPAEWNNR